MLRALTKTNSVLRVNNVKWIATSAKVCKDTEMVDMPDNSVAIPKYQQKFNEKPEIKKARLLYQSRKRGMLENGLLLSTFAARYLEKFDEKQMDLYDNLINQPTNDWDIYYYATNVKPTPEEYDNEIMNMLKAHASNKKKEMRIRQPDLYEKLD